MENICIVTGSSGLIGSQSVEFFVDKFDIVIGIDNNMRSVFFGDEASTEWNTSRLKELYNNFKHYNLDIRDIASLQSLFNLFNKKIRLIIHAAAQPSHDWAATDPFTDFSVNATGTLNMLEMTRKYCPDATFIFTSTNKVYGDTPNILPLVEKKSRWEIDESHAFFKDGIDESMSIDNTKHSLFGASKLSADILVQEYGRYFGMKTGVFRGGCLTGPNHSGVRLHGFLSYLIRCAITGSTYTIFGYKGKQVRDNIHSFDLVNMFWHYHNNPRQGEVYNVGGGRFSNCSIMEAIDYCEQVADRKMHYLYSEENRIGDHIWWISDINKFKSHFPNWDYKFSLIDIIEEININLSKKISNL